MNFRTSTVRVRPCGQRKMGRQCMGKRVTMVACKNELIVINFDDTINGGSGSVCADLVIAADGSNSVLREFLVP